MGDMCDKINVSSSSTSAPSIPQPVSATDEMSLLLQQILVGSSSSSLRSSVTGLFASQAVGDGILAVDSSTACLSANTNRAIGRHFASSSSVGPSENDNDNDEYDCESEEGLVALAEEMPEKSSIRRSSSKRSRAAEVHNVSEKRRRSKINEKMKALQNLIPNSNKTDKASMLDEAIEYLKQLQLQVQMLAMRNGLSLYPVTLPGGLHPAQLTKIRMDLTEDNRSLQLNLPGGLPFHQQTTSTQNLFPPPNQCSSSDQQLASDILNTADSETTIRLETPMLPHHAAFQLQSSAQDICKGNRVINQQTNANTLDASHLEFGEQAAATLAAFNRDSSGIKGSNSLETCLVEGDWSENLLRKVIEQSVTPPSDLNSMRTGRGPSRDGIKIEKSKPVRLF